MSAHPQRYRRPTDVVLLAVSGCLLVVAALRAGEEPAGMLGALADLLAAAPPWLRPLWQVAVDLLALWAILVVVLAVVRRHWSLVRDLSAAVALAFLTAALVGRVTSGSWPDLVAGLAHRGEPVDFPSMALAIAVAASTVVSPHLSRPFRYLGRWLVALATLGAAALGVGHPGEVAGAVAIGWLVGAALHLVFGSPGGLPSVDEVSDALGAIRVDARAYDVAALRGVVWAAAKDADGNQFDVKLYGRDAWDGQILVLLWRFLWYRDTGPVLSVSRLQQVEHEAVITLLAERRGAPVAGVEAAGTTPRGDALLVTRRVGTGLLVANDDIGDERLAATWLALRRLHASGITHGAIEPDGVRLGPDDVVLTDLASGELDTTEAAIAVDRAQLLVATALAVGPERACAAAVRALGPAELGAVVPYVQPAALTMRVRRFATLAGLDVDDLRAAAARRAGVEQPELRRLRRLTWGRALMAALLFIAGYALVTSLTNIGLDTILESVRTASVPLLLTALVLGQTPRFANAVALSAAAPTHVPLARLTALQFAICFVNLGMPSTAARVAVNVRFFERSGVNAPSAVGIGALDAVLGFVGQVLLIVTILLLGLGTLDVDVGGRLDVDPHGALIVAIVIIAVAAVAVMVLVAPLRRWVAEQARRLREVVDPLRRSPGRLAGVLGANIAAELLFALTMYTVLRAYGQDVAYIDVVLVNEAVALFAGLMPVPGGIGVTEAALTAGFIALGVDDATAFAAAITYRLCTYYLPPIVGVVAFRWLQRERYL